MDEKDYFTLRDGKTDRRHFFNLHFYIGVIFLDSIAMSLTSTALRLAMFAGQIVMTLFYGTLGTFATFALFVRLGRADFFKRVKRPTPPAVSTDPIYGKHEMKKLKVLVIFEL